ncbi:LysR substrate-binding domain-containing protein [Terriglobus roseus]|uniref:DNA-binding transcriptional regulator, LysR family n=1 Tax=Terriglobus roseus TaxID=392734 RepID=A0A1G7HLW7_9BACT|nr:LysR substrate-binding domain-containing protein [Terriglobus roseus]SDF01316.1 DNA-binding transcriptional regulator, LysR family [Terriglobus roseus]
MSEDLDFRQMRYFLAVAETLHFGRAASTLRIAQPNLSLQIKKIERALGHALFSRTTRGVALTPAGEFLAARITSLRGNFDDAIRTARRIGEGAEGTLSIAFSGSAMYGRLPFVLDHFRRTYPNVEVQLREMYAHEQQPLLLDGALDVGFIRDGARIPGLRMTALSKEPFVAVLPQSHNLAVERTRISPSALRNEAFVLFTPRIARLAFERTLAVCTMDGFTPNIVLEAPQWVTIVSLVAAGMGVSIAPANVARLNIPGAVFRPLRSRETSSIDLWTESAVRNPSALHLQKIAKEEFRKAV